MKTVLLKITAALAGVYASEKHFIKGNSKHPRTPQGRRQACEEA